MNSRTIPALIIAYRRHQNLADLLHLCISHDISPIYVSLDGPSSKVDKVETDLCRDVVLNLRAKYPGRIIERISEKNLGAANSILTSVTWAFETEQFLIVLEDDCVPTKYFFDFIEKSRSSLAMTDDCLLICGTQFAPAEVTHSKWAFSSYPLIWGWATSKEKWLKCLYLLKKFEQSPKFIGEGSFSERSFWHAGARRSYQGFVDAWDLPLVNAMRKVGAQALLPGVNLVKNIGNDEYATHTRNASKWLNMEIGDFNKTDVEPTRSPELDSWLRKNFYKIRTRHLITNLITASLDKAGVNKRKRDPLLIRVPLFSNR